MRLTPDLRQDIQQRLSAIEFQLERLRKSNLADEKTATKIDFLKRERGLRVEQLKLGRT